MDKFYNFDGCRTSFKTVSVEGSDKIAVIKEEIIRSEKLSPCPKCGNEAYIRITSNDKYCQPAVLCDNCDKAWMTPFIDMTDPHNSDVTKEEIIEKLIDMWNKRQFL